MWQTKAMIVMVLTSSLVLILFYSSLNLEEVHGRRAFVEAMVVLPSTPQRRNASVRTPGHRLTSARPPQHNEEPPASISATSRQAVPQALPPVSISDSFRKAVPQSSAYWNRRQHTLLKLLDSGSGGKAIDNETLGWPSCGTTSLESLVTNIPDFPSYPPLYQQFVQGMECRDPPILIDQPGKCTSEERGGGIFLLFAIKSIPRSFERRQAIRETWGREMTDEQGSRVRTVFLLGRSPPEDPSLDSLLHFEASHYRDILQWDFQESFYNLTLKDNAFMHWAAKRCPQLTFVFKGDDDVFANTRAMLAYLRTLNTDKATALYTGHAVTKASPFRDAKNKYYVPVSFFEGTYPPYNGGGGFLFSGSLIRPLLALSRFIPFFPIDDVYTGMSFKALGITSEMHTGFQTFDIREQDRQSACVHKHLILVHQRSPQQVLRLWKDIHSPLLTC